MKNNFFLVLLISITAFSFGQNGPVGHLTIFSEDGDKFTLILNGEVINDTPQTNLRVEDLNQPYYNAKIKFADQSLQDVSKNNLMITDVDGVFSDVTYKIKRDKNNKTKMKLNYFSSIPVQPNFIPASNVHVIHYGQPDTPPARGGVTQTTTTTTTQTNGVNVGVGVNVGGVNMGVTINDPMGGGAVSQTTTTTTTHVEGGNHHHDDEEVRGCGGKYCMSGGNFSQALTTIKNQSFAETQVKTAKQVANVNCVSVDQIIQIVNTFSFEENKVDFAKYAYDHCTDPKNYFKINDVFSFSSSVDELSDFVQSRQ